MKCDTNRPVLIDQSKMPHVRDQEWWDEFAPGWWTAKVRDDGMVELDAAVRYRFPDGRPGPWSGSPPRPIGSAGSSTR
jgi:hypothetical protein